MSRHYRRIRHRCVEARWIKPGPALVGNAPLWPWSHKDQRFQWAPTHTLNNRLESFVYLIAHEACHANIGHPKHFSKIATDDAGLRYTRTSSAEMEFRCNQFAMEAVEAFRKEWPTMKQRIAQAMRGQRAKVQARKASRVAARTDPAMKIVKAESMLVQWQRKQKLAANKVRKYMRRVKYYQGSGTHGGAGRMSAQKKRRDATSRHAAQGMART